MIYICPLGALSQGGAVRKKAKSKRKKCATRHCRNLTPLRKTGPRAGLSKGALCDKCRCARWRVNSPMRAAYHRLKFHAKDRGIEFTIGFDYFKKFAERTQLLTLTGSSGEALTVDRRDNLKGYIPGNIAPLTRIENAAKRAKFDQMRMERGYGWHHAC